MKFSFFIFSIFLFVNCSSGQGLRINDFEKCFTPSSPDDFSYLNKKNFLLAIDSIENEFDLGTFGNEATNEWLKLFYKKDSEGTEWVKIDYRIQSETAYKNFVESLKSSRYKFNSQSNKYEYPTSSYSQQTIELKEPEIISNKKYYRINFTDYFGKELSMPKSE